MWLHKQDINNNIINTHAKSEGGKSHEDPTQKRAIENQCLLKEVELDYLNNETPY